MKQLKEIRSKFDTLSADSEKLKEDIINSLGDLQRRTLCKYLREGFKHQAENKKDSDRPTLDGRH